MDISNFYTSQEVTSKLNALLNLAMDLENGIPDLKQGILQGEQDMPKRLRDKVKVNGKEKWITGYSNQELYESYVTLLEREGIIERVCDDDIPLFGEYALDYYSTFKQKQEQNTIINRERIIKNHILPNFGNKKIDRITTMQLQKWFNDLGKRYSHETLQKIKNTMNPVFKAAVEDDILTRNPLDSNRLELGGTDTVSHKAIPSEKLAEIKKKALELEGKERYLTGLLCYTGMRFEEILGLKWNDISDDWIHVKRAVVHPTRNQPVVKAPKTKTSDRLIPYVPELKELLGNKYKTGFILASSKDPKRETPLSYTEARRLFDKIRKRFDISEYSTHDFRDTCATEWRKNGIPLDIVARLLGHSKTETTEKRYVKYEEDMLNTVRKLM